MQSEAKEWQSRDIGKTVKGQGMAVKRHWETRLRKVDAGAEHRLAVFEAVSRCEL